MDRTGRRADDAPLGPVGSFAPQAEVASPLRSVSRDRAVDGVVVVLLLAFGLADFRFGDSPHQSALTLVFALAMPLPLLARRRRPFAAFCCVAVLAGAEWVVGTVAGGGNLALLVALYSVGAHARGRQQVVAAASIGYLGAALAVMRWVAPGQMLTAALLGAGTVTAAWVLGAYLRTRRAYVASVLERARTAERDRDQQALLAVTGERTRIAREMHDIVAHSVAVMVALSDGATATVDRDPEAAREATRQASATGRQALTEMQRLLGVLRDDAGADFAPQPGLAQLDELLVPVRAAGLQVRLLEAGVPAELPPSAQLAVYRVVQESVTNVLKHGAEVSHVVVTVRYGATAVDVRVEDDGRPRATAAQGGFGIVGMRERVAAFDGTLRAGPRGGAGWQVEAHLVLAGARSEP